MKNYSEITFKYLKVNKKRTALTIIGVILSVALFSGIGTMLFSYRTSQIEDAKSSLGNYEYKYNNVSSDKVDKIINNAEVLSSGIEAEWDNAKIKLQNNNLNLQVRAYDNSSFQNIMNKCFQIRKGRFPKSEDEIMLDMGTFYQLKNKKIGDRITVNLQKDEIKNYKIVGTYEYNSLVTAKAITFFKFSTKDNYKINVFLNLKTKRNKKEAIGNITTESNLKGEKFSIQYNDALLRSYFESPNELRNNFLVDIVVFLIGIIVVASAALIYNSFNISVMERIKHFGILRSIGATPVQIKKLVIKEAFYMCIIGIPVGFFAGYFGVYMTVKLMGSFELMRSSNFKISLYPQVFIISTILAVITIFLSAFNPVRKAGKISPMDALKNTVGIKNKRLKKRSNKIIKLLFGNEGELAYKNIKRLPGRFWVTVFSLVISIVLFIVFTTFISFTEQANKDVKKTQNYDSVLFNNRTRGLSLGDYDEISKLPGINKVYKLSDAGSEIYIPSNKFNSNFYNNPGYQDERIERYKDFIKVNNCDISSYDDKAFELAKKYLSSGEIDKEKLNDNGVLIVNKNKIQISGKTGDKNEYVDYSNYRVGDKIIIPKMKSYIISDNDDVYDTVNEEEKKAIDNKDFITLTVVGILNKSPLDLGNDGYAQDGMRFIFSEDMYKKLNGKLDYNGFGIIFKDGASRDKLYRYFEDKASEIGGYYTDYYKIAQDDKKLDFEMEVFVYGFISLIALISVVNIINTVSINLILRKAEFAMLMAIGMTKMQLTKMVLLEGALHGIIASIFGTLIGGGLDFVLIKIIGNSELKYFDLKLPITAIVSEILISILITLAASLIPLGKLKNMDVVENLREE